MPQWGTSNEYPQYMFLGINKTNIIPFWLKKICLIWRYGILSEILFLIHACWKESFLHAYHSSSAESIWHTKIWSYEGKDYRSNINLTWSKKIKRSYMLPLSNFEDVFDISKCFSDPLTKFGRVLKKINISNYKLSASALVILSPNLAMFWKR